MRNTTSPRRALVLVGPPKTGSSHVQAFLVANRDHLEKHGWTLPPAVDGRPADDKSFANLAGALANRSCSPHQWLGAPTLTDAILSLCHGRDAERRLFERRHEEVLHRFEQSFARIALSAAPNLVVSAEDLALFDGADARSVEARRTLRRLLQPFAEATVLIVYRTPRAPAVQSLFTEDLDWGYDGVREGAHGGMAAWLYRRLHNASLLTTAPWSSSTRVARLADAYASSGFAIQIISSTGAARDGLDTTDVLACEVLGVPCTDGKAAWSAYRRARTDETGYDGLASSVALTLPKLLRSAGCSSLARPGGGARHGDDDEDGGGAGALELLDGGGSGVSKAAAKRRVQLAAALVPELLHDGAATQCSDLHGLELLLRRYEADGLRRYRSRVLHWHAADFEAAADGGDAAGAGGGEADEFARRRTLCELDLASEATWAALRRLAARRGLSCGAAQHEGVYWLPAWALVCVLALLCCGRSRQGRDQRGRHGGRAGRHEDGDDDWASDDDCRDECAYGLELQCGLRAETLLRLLLALSVALLLGLQRADLWPAGAAPPTPVARPTQPQRSAGGGARAGGGGAQELPRGGAYYRVLCGPRCGFLPVSVLTAAAAPDVTSVPLQSEERARNVSRSARWPPTCVEDAGEAKTAPRTLYTILTSTPQHRARTLSLSQALGWLGTGYATHASAAPLPRVAQILCWGSAAATAMTARRAAACLPRARSSCISPRSPRCRRASPRSWCCCPTRSALTTARGRPRRATSTSRRRRRACPSRRASSCCPTTRSARTACTCTRTPPRAASTSGTSSRRTTTCRCSRTSTRGSSACTPPPSGRPPPA